MRKPLKNCKLTFPIQGVKKHDSVLTTSIIVPKIGTNRESLGIIGIFISLHGVTWEIRYRISNLSLKLKSSAWLRKSDDQTHPVRQSDPTSCIDHKQLPSTV
jgi:hypothetical protein